MGNALSSKIKRSLILGVMLAWGPMAANATIITSLYGDKDGFGQGVPIADGIDYVGNGGVLGITNVNDPEDPANTDFWQLGYPESMVFDYVLDGPVLSASLEIYVAGFANGFDVNLRVDGALLATYNFSPSNRTTHIIIEAVPVANMDGSTTFTLTDGPSFDGWMLDYAELTIETETAASVPEPVTLLLVGLGLAGLGVAKKRRHQATTATQSST